MLEKLCLGLPQVAELRVGARAPHELLLVPTRAAPTAANPLGVARAARFRGFFSLKVHFTEVLSAYRQAPKPCIPAVNISVQTTEAS